MFALKQEINKNNLSSHTRSKIPEMDSQAYNNKKKNYKISLKNISVYSNRDVISLNHSIFKTGLLETKKNVQVKLVKNKIKA